MAGIPDGRGIEAQSTEFSAAGEAPADALCRILDDHISEPGGPGARGHAEPPELKVLDDEVVLAFAPGQDQGPEDDPEALAAVFASTSPRSRDLLKESFFNPGAFYLGPESARLVVDPIPDYEDGELYSRVGATVVMDEQAASRELLALTAAALGTRHRREREVLGSPSRLERLRADMRTSWRQPALSTGQLEAELGSPERGGFFGRLLRWDRPRRQDQRPGPGILGTLVEAPDTRGRGRADPDRPVSGRRGCHEQQGRHR